MVYSVRITLFTLVVLWPVLLTGHVGCVQDQAPGDGVPRRSLMESLIRSLPTAQCTLSVNDLSWTPETITACCGKVWIGIITILSIL